MIDLEASLLAACLLEVTAPKPGNVHPAAAFAQCDWNSFCDSALAIAPTLARAREERLGTIILEAVRATRRTAGQNTNLGMILLLTPLAACDDVPTPEAVADSLIKTDVTDCRLVYEAIRLARPGGMGRRSEADIRDVPDLSLIQAMELARDRDAVARQFVTRFNDVFRLAEQFRATRLDALLEDIVNIFVAQLARQPDSLIARKCGEKIAREASDRARQALAQRPINLAPLDAWLRGDANRRNPGTSADLIAAGLFVAIHHGNIPCFAAEDILRFGNRRSVQRMPEVS